MHRMRLLGLDGCRGGWLVAEATSLETVPSFEWVERFEEIVRLTGDGAAMACVDVPIGLADGEAGRRCDGEARAMLRWPRSSSVFTPSCRSALRGQSNEERRALNLRFTRRSLSAQALGILPKIREVDDVMTPRLQRLIRETHPEVVFADLHPAGTGIAAGKKTAQGRRERLALLPPSFAAAAPTRASRPFPARAAALDDYVDALAGLVAVIRLSQGRALRLPRDGEDRDERGLVMEIVY
jgi:predicted RNase H-like nuclease